MEILGWDLDSWVQIDTLLQLSDIPFAKYKDREQTFDWNRKLSSEKSNTKDTQNKISVQVINNFKVIYLKYYYKFDNNLFSL